MKKKEAADARAEGESDAFIEAAVAPADVAQIFRPVVLRIEDKQVATLKKLNQGGLRPFRGRRNRSIGGTSAT